MTATGDASAVPQARKSLGLTDEEKLLWQAWLADRRQDDRLLVFQHYAPWMRKLAGHLAQARHPLADWGDYLHFAAIGMLQAIDRYRPMENVRFQSYAEHYIRGAVHRGLACYRKDLRLNDHRDRVAQHLERANGDGVGIDEFMNAAVDLAFGYFLETGVIDTTLPGQQNPALLHQHKQHVDFLTLYVNKLPDRERTLIRLHYFEQVAFAEIATLFGVSRPRITQLHAQALQRIRHWFTEVDASCSR